MHQIAEDNQPTYSYRIPRMVQIDYNLLYATKVEERKLLRLIVDPFPKLLRAVIDETNVLFVNRSTKQRIKKGTRKLVMSQDPNLTDGSIVSVPNISDELSHDDDEPAIHVNSLMMLMIMMMMMSYNLYNRNNDK